MTHSFNSSHPNKIVFIHGLNNHDRCFDSLRKFFTEQGFETEQVILPCHGKVRKEARTFEEAMNLFETSMARVNQAPYMAVAFSTGALYLQLWMKNHSERRPLKQILLAPAIHIKRQKVIETLTEVLPSWFFIKSLSPAPFRRYQTMNIWEYRMLIEGILKWQNYDQTFDIPTKILIDPKDELVDAKRLCELFQVELINRPYLKGLGAHHILFHPDYFTDEDWKKLLAALT